MFIYLTELNDSAQLRLSATEKAVLVSIYKSNDPKLGDSVASGNPAIVAAREFLSKNGLINSIDMQVQLTGNGSDVLEANGLVDYNGKITELGNTMVEFLNKLKLQYSESLITFKLLKQLTT